MLTPEQRLRFARHLSLVELGVAGQVALLASDLGTALSDEAAESVRVDYLGRAGLARMASASPEPESERAGIGAARGSTLPLDVDVDVDVASLAGAEYLRYAAAGVIGAFHAVERIKQVTGVGRRAALPSELRLIKDA